MKRQDHDDDLLRKGQRLRSHLEQVHDGTGDNALGMHRPGFRVTDALLSDELQRARDAYEHDLTTAWQRGAGKERAVSDAPSGNQLSTI